MVPLLITIKISSAQYWLLHEQLQHSAECSESDNLATFSRHKNPNSLGTVHGENTSQCGGEFSVEFPYLLIKTMQLQLHIHRSISSLMGRKQEMLIFTRLKL